MNEVIKNNDEKNPSMEQILQSIRGVISNKEDQSQSNNKSAEVLELTEIVNEDGSISSLKSDPATLKPTESLQSEDILNFIDNTLGIKEESPSPSDKNNQLDSAQKFQSASGPNDQIINNSSMSKDNPEISEEMIKNKTRLISDEAAIASSKALKTLVKTVSKPISDGLAFRSGTTVEDLAIELIKPYLSKWLDTHLPNIVKTLVEKEIQKLIPKDED